MPTYKITIVSDDDDMSFEVTASNRRAAFLTAAAEPVERDIIPAIPDPVSDLPSDDGHLLGLVW